MIRRWLAVSALGALTATSGYAQQAAASSVLPRAWAGGRPGRHAVGVRTIALDAVTACAAGLLSVRAGVGNSAPTDHTRSGRWAPGRVERIAAAGLAHGDFSDRHGALQARRRPAADAAAFRQRFGAVADQIVAYLVTTLRAH